MKEDLRQVWNQPNKIQATDYLLDWIIRAYNSGVSMLKNFAKTLSKHFDGILAYYDFPISTGPLVRSSFSVFWKKGCAQIVKVQSQYF